VSEALVYTLQRLALFVITLFVLALLGAEPILAVVLAGVISMGLSYVLLRKQRDALAVRIAERVEARAAARAAGEPTDADSAAEDATIDRAVTGGASEDAAPEQRRDASGSTGSSTPPN